MKTKIIHNTFNPVMVQTQGKYTSVSSIRIDALGKMLGRRWKFLTRYRDEGRVVEVWERKGDK